jgi:hypothetical protein
LYLKDVKTVDGVACLHLIEDSQDKRGGKTVNGERFVPLHDRLLALGFLDHVTRLRVAGATRLFECWKWHGMNGYWQQAVSGIGTGGASWV